MALKKGSTINFNLLKSILIIISYFVLPYLIGSITSSSLIVALFYVLYALILIIIYKDTFKNDFKDILKNKGLYLKKILLNFVLLIVVVIITNAIIGTLFNVSGTSENDYSLLNIFRKSPIVLILSTCVYYPVVEGIVFRKAIRDIVDKKWVFIIFSSLFYFFFNVVYTSMSFSNILLSISYIFIMMILSNYYWKTNNFTASVIVLMMYNIFVSILSF